MGVGAVEAGRRRSAAIGAAGIRSISRVIMMVIMMVIMIVAVIVVVAVMAMPEAADPEHPRAVGAAAGVRIAGVADLLAAIEAARVRRPGRHRQREDRLGGDHEAGGDAAERGHGDGSERPAR